MEFCTPLSQQQKSGSTVSFKSESKSFTLRPSTWTEHRNLVNVSADERGFEDGADLRFASLRIGRGTQVRDEQEPRSTMRPGADVLEVATTLTGSETVETAAVVQDVERLERERNGDVVDEERETGRALVPSARQRDRAIGDVDAGDAHAALGQERGCVATPATQIENRGARWDPTVVERVAQDGDVTEHLPRRQELGCSPTLLPGLRGGSATDAYKAQQRSQGALEGRRGRAAAQAPA